MNYSDQWFWNYLHSRKWFFSDTMLLQWRYYHFLDVSFDTWSSNDRNETTDNYPFNITEGAD